MTATNRNRTALLADLKNLLKKLETDLRERAALPDIHEELTEDYEAARKAERTAVSFSDWREDRITQKAVAWVLSCVFARFLEDNGMMDPPRISGPGERLRRARDEHELYFRSHPTETDREYLLDGFKEIGRTRAGGELFGDFNPVFHYPGWLGGDAAGELLEFFQRIDPETGALVHDFTDPEWDTRFLGDLYQDLSETARKRYALLQTPDFVEAFILDRTLEPALDKFGLNAKALKPRPGAATTEPGFRMIDPACGPGHFLLGAFDRMLERWRKAEPATSTVELVNRTLASVNGVDLNPFAVAIARFRLLLRALKAVERRRLADCPAFDLNVACGDSLLHGESVLEQAELGLEAEADEGTGIRHWYDTEDREALRRILRIGVYHAVVANPPYITVKDKAVNQACRLRYPEVCYRQYSLAMPFMQRIFELTCPDGFTGQITANSFMKREFGKKLVEGFLPKLDLTHVIDTSGAYIPGHGTPTVILFGRNRKPVGSTVRTVMGIVGEPSTPDNPADGKVWTAILGNVDLAGSQVDFVSVSDTDREGFGRHPWSMSGGGVVELKEVIESHKVTTIDKICFQIGRTIVVGEDDAWIFERGVANRLGLKKWALPLIIGESVRDWRISFFSEVIYPYEDLGGTPISSISFVVDRHLWKYRILLERRSVFGKTMADMGRAWWELLEHYTAKLKTPFSIVYGEVATHNHFVFSRGGQIFNRTAPIIKLKKRATENEHLELTGLLNSSIACFWLKQVAHNKGSTVDDRGARQRTAPFEDFFAFNGTRLKEFPIPSLRPLALPNKLDELASELSEFLPSTIATQSTPTPETLENAKTQAAQRIAQMIALQEELDWQCYGFYGLLDKDEAAALVHENPPEIALGQRAFEIVMARQMAAGELETTWFQRHNSTPITEIPAHWPKDYRELVEKRIRIIAENPRTIGLIEKPEYKRRWNLEPWDSQLETALWNWLLDRLESYFDFDGRMNDENRATAQVPEKTLISAARLADIARADKDFMQVAELYRQRPDFDVSALVHQLVDAETVPLLPACRYKPSGLEKRAVWERTWELQRLEDAIDALFDIPRLKDVSGDGLPLEFGEEIQAIGRRAAALDLPAKDQFRNGASPLEWLEDQVKTARDNIRRREKFLAPEDDPVFRKRIQDIADAAKGKLVGDIPVPPKYAGKDFQKTHFWRLRGKLDVPKERWVGFPHCEGPDQSPLIAWAGCDHLQLALAVAGHYMEVKEVLGGSQDPRLEILLAALLELLPWLKQWHNHIDPEFLERMGDYFEGFIDEEAKTLQKSLDDIRGWRPPATGRGRGRK